MQKNVIFGVVAAAAMALVGCGSTCDDLADATEKVQEKEKACATAGYEPTAFNVNQCENNLDRCSDSEKEALAKLADCLRDLPECTPATKDSYVNAALACGLAAKGKVGANCLTIMQ